MRNVRGSKSSPLRMAHELQSFLEDLMETVFDVHGEVLSDIILKIRNADRFGNVLDSIGIPEHGGGHPGCEGWIVGQRGCRNRRGFGRAAGRGRSWRCC